MRAVGNPQSSRRNLGLGGHSEAILQRIPNVCVIGLDRDTQALALATERLASFGERFLGIHTEYHHIADVIAARTLLHESGAVTRSEAEISSLAATANESLLNLLHHNEISPAVTESLQTMIDTVTRRDY